jgi:hypothetical protein
MRTLTNEEEDLIFETKPKLFSIGIITLSKETVSLLSVGISEIRSNKESNSKKKDIRSNNYKSGAFNYEIDVGL